MLMTVLCLSSGTVLAQTATVPDSAAVDSTAVSDSTAADSAAVEPIADPDTAGIAIADTTAAADSTASEAEAASPGLISEIAKFFREGGFAMWPILLFLAAGLAIMVERAVFLFFKANIKPEEFMARIADLIRKGSIEGAIAASAEEDAPLARIIESALRNYRGTERDIQNAVDEMALAELPRISARTGYLAMLANVSTMVGLLGTIFGLIQAFAAVSAADPEAKGRILASGIAMAMNTTAFGLIVAIPQLIVHSFLTSKADGLVDDIDRYSVMVINMLAQARKEG
ncbi:MAG: MotA/TolQ/ExbB proton channel family protein [Candidatus Fermentibacter sp.]|nr:MotA/TolQ/ExbB proton channel family protein [Candidatus Fermentibacter sp.]